MGMLLTVALYAQRPTPDNLAAALANAKLIWGVDVPDAIVLRAEPLNACKLEGMPHIAEIQPVTSQTVTRFDDGSEVAMSPVVTWVIRINGNCDWSRQDLNRTIMHEYGHLVIGLAYHSADRRSIMFPVVLTDGSQAILAADRARIMAAVAGK